MILIAIALYFFSCYVVFRLVAKFDAEASLWQALIPFWNWYMVVRAAVNNPVGYFWAMVLIPIAISIVVGVFSKDLAEALGSITAAIMTARVMGSVAEKLGKNFWLYAILSVIPLLNAITFLVLAFDSSKPSQVIVSE